MEKVGRKKFRGLGRILRMVGQINGGVRLRYGNQFSLVSVFVPKDGGQPTFNVMDDVRDPLERFLSRDGDSWSQYFVEYADNCFLSGDGAWTLMRDELVEIVGGGS